MAESRPGAGDHKDAVFFSPHKLIGGPQTPGVLVVRRGLARNRVPTVPGGGTIAFVDPVGHRYLDDPVGREEGGTPAIVESIRAGLVVALKQAVGTDLIQAREQRFLRRALDRWRANPNLELLGDLEVPRLPIVSFRIRHGDRYLHHELVVALLNDLFGIQARGGCSCAGPVRAPAARHRPRPVAGPERAGRPGLPRHQARLGPAQLQLLHQRHRRRLPGRGGRPAGPARPPAAGRLRLRPAQRPLAPPPGTPRPGPRRWPACSTASPAPGPGPAPARTPWPATSSAARALLAARPVTGPADGAGPTWLPPELERLRDFSLPPLPA